MFVSSVRVAEQWSATSVAGSLVVIAVLLVAIVALIRVMGRR